MRGPSTVVSGGRMAVGAVMRRRLHVEIVCATVGAIVRVTIAPTVAPTIASSKRRLKHPPLVVVGQAVIKNKARMQHMHKATSAPVDRTRRSVNDDSSPPAAAAQSLWTGIGTPPRRSTTHAVVPGRGRGLGPPSDVPSRLDC